MKVSVDKNFITITFEDTYLAGDEMIILKERYLLLNYLNKICKVLVIVTNY